MALSCNCAEQRPNLELLWNGENLLLRHIEALRLQGTCGLLHVLAPVPAFGGSSLPCAVYPLTVHKSTKKLQAGTSTNSCCQRSNS